MLMCRAQVSFFKDMLRRADNSFVGQETVPSATLDALKEGYERAVEQVRRRVARAGAIAAAGWPCMIMNGPPTT